MKNVNRDNLICELVEEKITEKDIYYYLTDNDISIEYVKMELVNEDHEELYAVSIGVLDEYGYLHEFYELYPLNLGTDNYPLFSLQEDLEMYLADNEIDY